MTIRTSRYARSELGAAADQLPAGPAIHSAMMGDQHGILDFLTGVFRTPTAAQFQVQLEDPFYEPADRQLVRHQGRIAGHVRVVPREIRFGGLQLAVAELCELAVAPALRRRGLGAALLKAGERRARGDGALLSFVHSSGAPWFQRQGWIPFNGHCYSQCDTRELLARLSQDEVPQTPARELSLTQQRALPLSTRIWRHVEREALVRIYDANTRHGFGPVVRSEDYWHWLISRHAFGQVYVAVEGRDRWSLDNTPIVGYAIVHRDRVVELMADPRRPDAVRNLLARVGGEFIEHDFHNMRLDAAPDSSCHELCRLAGGRLVQRETDQGQRWLVRILHLPSLLKELAPLFAERARLAKLDDCELSVKGGEHAWRLIWKSGELSYEVATGSAHQVLGDVALPTQLILAQTTIDDALAAGRARVTSPVAHQAARVFFPRLAYWQTPLDYLNT